MGWRRVVGNMTDAELAQDQKLIDEGLKAAWHCPQCRTHGENQIKALLARVRLKEAEHIQFEVNWRLGNPLLSEDPKIKEAHKWLKEHLATLRVPLEQAACGSAAGSEK